MSSLHPDGDRLDAGAAAGVTRGGAELRASLPAGAKLASTETLELELNGVFVPCATPLPVGTVVSLKLKLSESGPSLPAMARVVATIGPEQAAGAERAPGMRLEFMNVWGERLTEQLASFLREAEQTQASPSSRSVAPLVLVVDDDPSYRELSARVMRESGFEVLTASHGLEALSLALRHQPSLVISDVTMPSMDGWQFLRMVRARPELRRMPVIFLTELTSDDERLRGYQLGVDDYVPKPFTGVELTARVERVLERANAAEEAVANGMRGDLSKVPLTSLLMLCELERRSGVVQLMRPGENATLHLREGVVVRIELAAPNDTLEGMARFFYVLEWESGRFELSTDAVPVERALDLRTSHVLLEHARRRDEAAAR